jgi:2-polyprenyl-3-methyl-5-hydroxy-6-metoxy-1,4-benzoquinol methylase
MKKILQDIKLELYFQKEWFKKIWIYPPTIALQKIDYDKYWENKRGSAMGEPLPWQKDRINIIAGFLKDEKNISIIDIGGGEGNIPYYLKHKNNIDIGEMYNADTSKIALERSEQFGLKSIFCDIADMKSFEKFPETDYAFMLEILEHIPNSEEFLLEIMQYVRKGIFFSIPNSGFYVYRLRLLFGKAPMQWTLHPAEHLRFWTVTDVKYWLDNLGFKGKYTVNTYKGVPMLNKILPKLFAAGMVVEMRK